MTFKIITGDSCLKKICVPNEFWNVGSNFYRKIKAYK